MTKNYFLIWILLCCFSSAIAQNYVPLKIVSGFNADVIANGVGAVSSSTTHTFDLTTFNLVSRDFLSQAGNSPLTFGLPVDGRIVASNDSNLIFQLNPYSQNNSLRLTGWGSTGDLVFETPENATRIDILTAAGNAAGSAATFSGEVHFTDNTIQSFNGLYAEDWYSYRILSPIVTYGIGRVRVSDNVLEKLNDFPRLYGAQINISVNNYYKKISSIRVFKTTSTTEVLHIMAVTVKKTPDCFQPTNVQVNNIATNQATISWSAAIVSPNLGYEYEIRTSGLPGSGLSGLVASGAVADNTILKDITNLSSSITYFVYVRSKCTATSFSDWSLPKRFETKCLPPTVTVTGNSICKPGTVNLTATTTNGVLKWYDSPTSQTVLETGGSYTTPALTATKSYWVDATSSNFINLEGGKKSLHSSANEINTFNNWGIVFDLTHDVHLKSTDVFVAAPGTLNVAIYDGSGTEVSSTGDLTVSALGVVTPVTIPLNVQLKAGTGYRLLIKAFNGTKLYRDSSVSFPYKDVSEILSVTSGFFDGYTKNYYYYFYNLVFEKGCKSPRQEVIATVSNSLAPTTTLPIQTFCFEQGTQLKNLSVNGSNIKWYNASTGGNQWSETALVTNGTTYYASQTVNGCESIDRTAIQVTIYNTIEPTASDQTFCIAENKTIADLIATGTAIKWYDVTTGGSSLATSDILTTKNYYASQTLNGCESVNRTPVQVTIYNTIEPTASNQTFCITENKTIADLIATGTAIKWYDVTTGGISLANSDILTTKTYYASQTLNGCESVNRTPVQVTIYDTTEPTASDQAFCIAENKTIADLIATGTAIKWYDAATSGSPLTTSDILTTKTYYASQTLNDCESKSRTPVQVTIYDLAVPTVPDQEFCAIENKTIGDIETAGTIIKWYANTTTTNELSSSTRLNSGIYYAVAQSGSCNSNRIPVNVTIKDTTVPTGETIQYMCAEKEHTIIDLQTDQEEILWYDSAIGGLPLSSSVVLKHMQKYYASFTGQECESNNRLEVQIVIRSCDVIIHNGISANGDGKNDYFSIEGINIFSDNKLEIFNRWGNLVYETKHYGQNDNLFKGFPNTGSNSKGGLLPEGTYYYVFHFTNLDNHLITKTGFLHLNY
jgi:gliding motility-associated-like protein